MKWISSVILSWTRVTVKYNNVKVVNDYETNDFVEKSCIILKIFNTIKQSPGCVQARL